MIEHSEKIDQLYRALFKAQQEITQPERDKKNIHHKYDYASLGAYYKTIKPILQKHDLCLTQDIISDDHDNQWLITTILHITTTQYRRTRLKIYQSPTEIQKFGGAITYCCRYLLRALFCLEGDEDHDGEENPSYIQSKPQKTSNALPGYLWPIAIELKGEQQIRQQLLSKLQISDITQIEEKDVPAILNYIKKLKQ